MASAWRWTGRTRAAQDVQPGGVTGGGHDHVVGEDASRRRRATRWRASAIAAADRDHARAGVKRRATRGGADRQAGHELAGMEKAGAGEAERGGSIRVVAGRDRQAQRARRRSS